MNCATICWTNWWAFTIGGQFSVAQHLPIEMQGNLRTVFFIINLITQCEGDGVDARLGRSEYSSADVERRSGEAGRGEVNHQLFKSDPTGRRDCLPVRTNSWKKKLQPEEAVFLILTQFICIHIVSDSFYFIFHRCHSLVKNCHVVNTLKRFFYIGIFSILFQLNLLFVLVYEKT